MEELINRTNIFYQNNNIAFIEKRYLPIKIIKKINDNIILGKLIDKSLVDYSGIYQGKHIEFEAKETNKKYFNIRQILTHQFKYLIKANKLGAKTFIIIYFSYFDEFYLVNLDVIEKWIINKQKNKIPYEYIKDNCSNLDIEYPGIINYIKKI